ncbi:MAG: hypothetical protein ABR987_20765 [Terracidiphilus sp.]|jgi:hypothetical protein
MERYGRDFAEAYSKMSDDELVRLEVGRELLPEEAKLALGKEIQKRQISIPNAPPGTEGSAEGPEDAKVKAGSSWGGRLLVFLAWSAVGLTLVLIAFGRGLSSEAAGAFAYHTTQMFLSLALAGWGITGVVAGRWLTIKRTMIIATIMYIIVIGWFAINLPQ